MSPAFFAASWDMRVSKRPNITMIWEPGRSPDRVVTRLPSLVIENLLLTFFSILHVLLIYRITIAMSLELQVARSTPGSTRGLLVLSNILRNPRPEGRRRIRNLTSTMNAKWLLTDTRKWNIKRVISGRRKARMSSASRLTGQRPNLIVDERVPPQRNKQRGRTGTA